MKTIVGLIDSITEQIGMIARWLALALVVLGTYEVIMRYVFGRPSLWVYEVLVMMGASLAAIGFSYAHRHRAHIRVDVLYVHLSPRGKAIVEVIGTLIIFFPLMIITTHTAIEWTWRAWEMQEVMDLTGWFPPAWPVKTVVVLGFCLFLLQGIANFIRDLYLLVRNKPL